VRIVIDESGPFVPPLGRLHDLRSADRAAFSCIGAVVVPDASHEALYRSVQRLCVRLGLDQKELHGRALDESQISSIVEVARSHGLLYFVEAIDLARETVEDIEEHKKLQAALLLERVEVLQPDMQDYVRGLSTRVAELPAQLYVQLVLLNRLCFGVLRSSTLWFSQVMPTELEHVGWALDAKDRSPTEYERLWRDIVMPFAQTDSARQPFIQLREGDYSRFAKYFNPSQPRPPEYLAPHLAVPTPTFESLNINAIFDDISFVDSASNRDVQLADVLTNAFRRACNGRLRRRGWRNIGRLMLKRHSGYKRAVQLSALGSDAAESVHTSVYAVLEEIERKARLPILS
jgi:hypothetical protein